MIECILGREGSRRLSGSLALWPFDSLRYWEERTGERLEVLDGHIDRTEWTEGIYPSTIYSFPSFHCSP